MIRHMGILAGALLAIAPLIMNEASAEEPRLSGVKAFTVEYELEGIQEGTVVQHVKNWGRNSVEIINASTTVMGFTTATNQKSVVADGWITTIDYANNSATKVRNPFYDAVANGLQGKDPMEVGQAMLEAMGGQSTGETRSYAGESCSIWEISNMGQEICITDDGLTLYLNAGMMGMSMTRTATSVERGNPGPDSAYEVPDNIPVTELPF